jgi:glycosyltransferase involved in cell wall biosynthesis
MDSGYLCQGIAATLPTYLTNIFKVLSFEPNMRKWKFRYRINTNRFEAMTNAAKKTAEKLDNRSYDVILQVGAWYDLTGFKEKVVVSYHDGNLRVLLDSPYGYPNINYEYIERGLNYEKNIYKKLHHIFTMSEWLATSFQKDFEVEAKRVTAVGAGINLPYIREINNKAYSEPNLLFIGKDFQRKGGKVLLQAFEKVRKEIKNATLTLIGPNLAQSSLPEGVKCLGYISKLDKIGLEVLLNEYTSASVFVMPSLYEPFGIVFAEAMAHKLPCIGTSICAMPEIVDEGETGFLVPPGDERTLEARIVDLLKQPEMCREMGERGYQKYISTYRWDVVTRKIVDKLEGLLL